MDEKTESFLVRRKRQKYYKNNSNDKKGRGKVYNKNDKKGKVNWRRLNLQKNNNFHGFKLCYFHFHAVLFSLKKLYDNTQETHHITNTTLLFSLLQHFNVAPTLHKDIVSSLGIERSIHSCLPPIIDSLPLTCLSLASSTCLSLASSTCLSLASDLTRFAPLPLHWNTILQVRHLCIVRQIAP